MVPEAMPKSLLVVGTGAIGIEFACFYRAMGAEVTVVEVLDRVLPVEDEEISAFARKGVREARIKIRTGAKVKALKQGARSSPRTIESGRQERSKSTVERVILAVGIIGNIEEIGLEGTGVKVERSHIVVDEWCAPANPASMRSAMSSARHGWRTRRATRA